MTSSISGMGGLMGQMNVQEMQQRMFKKIDSNGDGGLDKTEFSDIAKKMSEMSGKSVNTDDVFSKYDANGDGSMSADELDSFMKDNAPAPPSQMQSAMSAYGANNQTDRISAFLESLKNQSSESSDSDSGTNSISSYISKMLENLGSGAGSQDIFSLLSVKA